MLVALIVTILFTVSYLGLYTAYDKQTKSLKLSMLMDVLLFSKGLDHSLVQWNKVISLVGLSIMSVALLPNSSKWLFGENKELLYISIYLQTVHAIYSCFKYYGSNNIPYITTFVNFFQGMYCVYIYY